MKTLYEIKNFVNEVLNEAKKKKGKVSIEPKGSDREVEPSSEDGSGYKYAEAFDFSKPLGALNLYRKQGQVNWGPHTGVGQSIPQNDGEDSDVRNPARGELEAILRGVVKESVVEEVNEDVSAWTCLVENMMNENPWHAAMTIAENKSTTGKK